MIISAPRQRPRRAAINNKQHNNMKQKVETKTSSGQRAKQPVKKVLAEAARVTRKLADEFAAHQNHFAATYVDDIAKELESVVRLVGDGGKFRFTPYRVTIPKRGPVKYIVLDGLIRNLMAAAVLFMSDNIEVATRLNLLGINFLDFMDCMARTDSLPTVAASHSDACV